MAIGRNSEDALIPIVASIEVHRRQIIFDALDTETGEVSRGRIDATAPAVDDVTVSDEEILAAMRLLFERLKTVAEPSGASALAASAGRSRAGNVGIDRFVALLGRAVRSSQRRGGET
jgi:threonine dehydratase